MCSNKHKFRVRRDWDLLTAPPSGCPDVFPMSWPKTRNWETPEKAKANTRNEGLAQVRVSRRLEL